MAFVEQQDGQKEGAALAGLRVLIVEDDFLLAHELEEAMKDAGCRVSGLCGTVDAALAFLQRPGCEVDGAFLDVDLQGVKATAVAMELIERGIPFVVITGYDYDSLASPLRRGGYVAKPMSSTTLVEVAAGRFVARQVA